MKITVISDTHGTHAGLGELEGDVLIHCGDFCLSGSHQDQQLQALDAWFGRQRFRHVLCIGGNHDFLAEELHARGQPLFRHARYLMDETVQIEGLRFHGAPWIPELTGWAHYRNTAGLTKAWERIPDQLDVLITHTPPSGILDRNSRGKSCGCPLLRLRLKAVRPRVHCFGHIHASSGMLEEEGTRYINASLVNSRYALARSPITFELAAR